MNAVFLNENTLGHTSYLPRFADELLRRPELGVIPRVLDALPLPPHLRRLGDTSVRGLRKVGLDFHGTRWRVAASRHLREQLDELRQHEPVDALVVNTQSMGLALGRLPLELPIFVALDATFAQLAHSPWFAPNAPSRWLQPLTLRGLLRRERGLFARATQFLPWSEPVAESLRQDYAVPDGRITLLPPSLTPPPRGERRAVNARPQLLFLGGDFFRKGGPLLRACHERFFADRCDLHLVTQSEVPAGPGVFVHRGVKAGSEVWRRRWREADVFVFPSRLETFGIVLLEALAFEVPVVASDAGAARSILGGGRFGKLLPEPTPEALRQALDEVLADPVGTRERARLGREHFEGNFDLATNTARLAGWLLAARKRV
ncbi:MAG TPA: glycosyltransferase family 4 protein [Candidatus Limnocylindria bacterium]|nr:glycosyltransferase family 4 protein [Candidatus Limnocylindria bacterium]